MKKIILVLLIALFSGAAWADGLPAMLAQHKYKMKVEIGNRVFNDIVEMRIDHKNRLEGNVKLPGVFDESIKNIVLDHHSKQRYRHVSFDILINEGGGPLKVRYHIKFDTFSYKFTGMALSAYMKGGKADSLQFLGWLTGEPIKH